MRIKQIVRVFVGVITIAGLRQLPDCPEFEDIPFLAFEC